MKDKLNIPPFYIGQKVVAIKDHSQGYFKKGDEFVVGSIFTMCCDIWVIKTHIKSNIIRTSCAGCGKIFIKDDSYCWFNARAFAPLQQQSYPLMTFSKIVEKEKEEILINN